MLTVRQVAERYGVSTAFLIQALGRVGFGALTPDSQVTTAAAARFEAEYGDKIRAARPEPPPAFSATTEAAPPRPASAVQHVPHVMRVAHEKVTGVRLPNGMRDKALLNRPGLLHVIDPAGTHDGDPWRGQAAPGSVHFYGGAMDSGPFAACGTTKVRAVLGDEFVPADDPARAGQCPRCAQVVADGKGFRTPPHERPEPNCRDHLRLRMDGRVVVERCFLRGYHSGPHRTHDGAKWSRGVEDYVPAEADAGRTITEAS